MRMSKQLILGAALAAIVSIPSSAGAVVISGTGSLGSFTGTFDYDNTTHAIDVLLTNTSNPLNGGFITGFVFNLPDGASVTGSTFSSSNASFKLLGATTFDDNVNAQPFGDFDIGASLSANNWEGSGNPTVGIGVTSFATFHFVLTGANSVLNSLTASDFLSTLSNPRGKGNTPEDFVVRFRGFENGGSDKVPNGPGVPLPEPAPLAALGLGLISMSAVRRRARAGK
jgi:hypothetical protein